MHLHIINECMQLLNRVDCLFELAPLAAVHNRSCTVGV